MRAFITVLSVAVLSAACGDDATGPAPERNDPGTGTRNMRVTADIEGKDVPGGFVTEFSVQLRDAQGNPISGATVTVKNPNLGTVNLLEDGLGTGDYRATRNQFAAGDYRLDVVKDTMEVRGVVVGGMAVHSITSPSADDTVPANAPLVVTWTRPSEAAGADVETRDFAAEGIPDTGSYTISAANNPPRDDQRIRIQRFNRVEIAGGLFGSRLTLKIRNTVEPVVVR
jgi:hypothetical protein